ncbi:MAG: 4a-hydroxytetrahydrobiopterin dehydratase [Caldilineaceae bacterium]|nr:4a-hydroxytetrahydrobiopterin dehydratase [Caldilineaceae bacterium]
MVANTALTDQEIAAGLQGLPGWSVQAGKLHRAVRFQDFVTAFTFMTQVAFAAEAAGHHPAWNNVYNQVTIDLATHSAGDAITQKDLDLAAQIERLAEKWL